MQSQQAGAEEQAMLLGLSACNAAVGSGLAHAAASSLQREINLP